MSKVVKAFQINLGRPFEVEPFIITEEPVVQEEDEFIGYRPSEEEIGEQIIEDANKEARGIKDIANRQAQKVLSKARQDIEIMKAEAFSKSKTQGYDDGYKAGKDKARENILQAEHIRQNAQDEYVKLLDSAEEDIINLLLDIVKNIMGEYLQVDSNAITSIVKKTLSRLKAFDNITLKVSEKDFDFVNNNINEILKQSSYKGNIDIEEDITLVKGDCIIETPSGTVDGGVQTQLKAIENTLYNLLKQRKE